MRKTVASWLEENVNVLNGLTWIDKENYVVKITWERLGSLNSKTTIDICKAYVNRTTNCEIHSESLSDSEIKNRFYEALKKSPFVEMEKHTSFQTGNFLKCKIKTPSQTSYESIDMTPANSAVSASNTFCHYSEKPDTFKITLLYEGVVVVETELDLSPGYRFHYGDHHEQYIDVDCAGRPEIKPYYSQHLPQTFPVYNQGNERLRNFLATASHGIFLRSVNGNLEGIRLSQIKIYRNQLHSNVFTKMERFKKESLLSDSYSNEELVFSFGKRPKLGTCSLLMLKVKPARMAIDNDISLTVSSEISIDRVAREFGEMNIQL